MTLSKEYISDPALLMNSQLHGWRILMLQMSHLKLLINNTRLSSPTLPNPQSRSLELLTLWDSQLVNSKETSTRLLLQTVRSNSRRDWTKSYLGERKLSRNSTELRKKSRDSLTSK